MISFSSSVYFLRASSIALKKRIWEGVSPVLYCSRSILIYCSLCSILFRNEAEMRPWPYDFIFAIGKLLISTRTSFLSLLLVASNFLSRMSRVCCKDMARFICIGDSRPIQCYCGGPSSFASTDSFSSSLLLHYYKKLCRSYVS